MALDLLDTGLNPWDDKDIPKELDHEGDSIESTTNRDEDIGSGYDSDWDGPSTGLGTGTIVSAINRLPNQSSNNIFDVIMINVATLIRNNVAKDKSAKEISQAAEADVRDLIRTIGNYHESMGGLIHQPMVIFYLPDYSWLPALHARPITGNRKIITEITNLLVKEDNLITRKRIRGNERQTTLLEIYAGGKSRLPYKSIIFEMSEIFKLGRIDPRSALMNYLLISHAPLDYHFMLNYPRVTLLESFSGKLLKPKTLGYKVFGTNFIPFNSVTHLLFGDKTHVRPMAQRKNRALLTDMAKRQSWHVRTPTEIAKFVGDSGQVEARILTHLRF